MILRTIKQWWQSLKMYVVVDPSDNSVTFSKYLFRHLQKHTDATGVPQIYVFQLSDRSGYGFVINTSFKEGETQLCNIQYNDQHKCIGFETLCPSVGAILYEYQLPYDKTFKLSVSTNKAGERSYYKIERPCTVS
ncbi:MAG: hypothetical protein SNH27_04950 [Rikenellaceae bacterium]